MKWLSRFGVVALVCLALLCVFSPQASAQCANGRCNIGQGFGALPGPYFGGPVVFAPVAVAPHCGERICNVEYGEGSPQGCQLPIQYACGAGSCCAPRYPQWQSNCGYQRSGSVGISLNWGRAGCGRYSNGWR